MSYTLAYTGAEIDALLGKIDAIFVAEYGSTIYSEVTAAIAAGNKVIVANAGKVFVYAGTDDNSGYVFTQSGPNAAKPNATYVTLSTGNVWSTATVDLATLQQFYASLMEDTASGSIASFPDGAENVPVKELTADIEPIQDLHRQASPYPAGASVNKFDPSTFVAHTGFSYAVNTDGSITVTSNGSANDYSMWLFTGLLAAGTYTVSAATGSRPIYIQTYNTDYSHYISAGQSYTFDYDGTSYLRFMGTEQFTAAGTKVYKLQLESGSSATTFVPYSNICPISGYTGAEITRTGKNLFDKGNPNAVTRYIDISGHTLPYNANARTVYIPCKPNTTYTVSRIAGQRFIVAYTIDEPTTAVTTYGEIVNQTASSITITTGADARYLIVFCHLSTADTLTFQQILDSLQIELGSTATAYEPYNGTTYSVSWSDHGTIYKGNLNATTGVLTITGMMAVFDGSVDESWNKHGTSAYNAYYLLATTGVTAKNGAFNWLKYASSLSEGNNTGFVSNDSYQLRKDEITSVADLRTYLAANPLQMFYEIGTPQTVQLTPTEVQTLLGDNNIWSNTGDISVKYRANTALYIEKKLGE